MTREEFIEILEWTGYSYEIVGDKIVVTRGDTRGDKDGHVWLGSLETLPPRVEFKHGGGVALSSLKTLPPGVEFRNGGSVDLGSLETLPRVVEFKNGGNVFLESLKTLPPGVKFENGGSVALGSIETIPPGVEFNSGVFSSLLFGGWFSEWKGNIEGISPNTLLNKMIEDGLFYRR